MENKYLYYTPTQKMNEWKKRKKSDETDQKEEKKGDRAKMGNKKAR